MTPLTLPDHPLDATAAEDLIFGLQLIMQDTGDRDPQFHTEDGSSLLTVTFTPPLTHTARRALISSCGSWQAGPDGSLCFETLQ